MTFTAPLAPDQVLLNALLALLVISLKMVIALLVTLQLLAAQLAML